MKSLEKLSIFISLLLRHKPELIGASLDKEGYMLTKDLIEGVKSTGRKIDFNILKEIVDNDEKGRYSFKDNYKKIRANQGHSIEGLDLGLQLVREVEDLYHGTSINNISSILNSGITKSNRTHVHLSRDIDTAISVGRRKGVPVVLVIDAKRMVEDNVNLFISENGVYLADYVSSKYVKDIIKGGVKNAT